ncbi:hypothetical protein T03_1865 [Trichinella britovi]|uniref:Uncharacterized protein n=1 Tax=Trichinella britovi TaxID=45882 RepID=A0A0V1D652_TRIBR|nr:hypothetical protein T03_1865 [Trichinella britovi]
MSGHKCAQTGLVGKTDFIGQFLMLTTSRLGEMGEKQLGPSEFRPTSVGTDAEKAVPEVNNLAWMVLDLCFFAVGISFKTYRTTTNVGYRCSGVEHRSQPVENARPYTRTHVQDDFLSIRTIPPSISEMRIAWNECPIWRREKIIRSPVLRMNDDQNEQADLGLPNFIRPSQTPTGKQFNSNRPSSVCCPPVRMESSPVMAAARRRQPTPAVAEGQPPTSPFPFHNIQADKTLVHVVNQQQLQLVSGNGYALDKLLNGCCCRMHNQERKLVPEGNIDQFAALGCLSERENTFSQYK